MFKREKMNEMNLNEIEEAAIQLSKEMERASHAAGFISDCWNANAFYNENRDRQIKNEPNENHIIRREQYHWAGFCPCCGREAEYILAAEYGYRGVCHVCCLHWRASSPLTCCKFLPEIYDTNYAVFKWIEQMAKWKLLIDKFYMVPRYHFYPQEENTGD